METQRQENTNSDAPKVDWDKLNDYVIEECKLQEPETLTGYVSMIVELGTQHIENSKMPFSGTPEDEAKLLAEEKEKFGDKGTTYFEDLPNYQAGGRIERHKCWENKDAPCVAIAIDFPSIMLDKGQFFDDAGKPMPLRIWLGGSFWSKLHSCMTIGSLCVLKENKKDFSTWSFGKKHLLHKMAVAAKIVGSNEPFTGAQVEELLGKSMQFSAQITRNPKGYYAEKCRFVGGIGRGQEDCEIGSQIACVSFNTSSPEADWKNVANHVRNTVRIATNYQGSAAQAVLEPAPVNTAPPSSDIEDTIPF